MKRDLPAERPGLAALSTALRRVYPLQEPLLFRTPEECESLLGILIYKGDPTDVGHHWHFVTLGLTELFGKESSDPNVSGWGFELTMRAPIVEADGDSPPQWPADLLLWLAEYVFETKHAIEPGHNLDLMNPILEGSKLSALLFRPDELGAVRTENGAALFLQAVGITADELEAVRTWNANPFLAILAEKHPGLLTILDRASILDDETIRSQVQTRVRGEGSAQGIFYADRIGWQKDGEQVVLTLGPEARRELARALVHRLPHGPWLCLGDPERNDSAVAFVPGDAGGWTVDSLGPQGGGSPLLAIRLSVERIGTLRTELTDAAGEIKIVDGVTLKRCD